MSNADIRGRFVWHELMTTDPEAASTFYSRVVPWKAQPSAALPSYTLWMAGKMGVGGLMAADDAGEAPCWLVYIGTPDVDATLEEAERLGASVVKPAADVPQVGRFAVLKDPQGALFALFTPAPSSAGSGPASGPGTFSWHELATSEPERATSFYAQLFGWEKGEAHDLGEMGTYQILEHEGKRIGGIHRTRPSTAPRWLSYIEVADAARAATEVKAAGGRVVNGPVEVPDGSRVVMLVDPQGAAIAVHEPVEKAKPARKVARKPRPVEAPPRAAAAEQPKPAVTSEPVSMPEVPSSPPPVLKRPKRAVRRVAKKAPPRKVAARKAATRKTVRVKRVARKAAKPAARTIAKKRPAVKAARTGRRPGRPPARAAGKRAAARKAVRGRRR